MENKMNMSISRMAFIIIMSMMSTFGLSANPDDGDNLYVFTKGSTQAIVYSLDNLDKITFGSNAVSLWTNNGREDYNYGNLSLLTFREDVYSKTGMESLTLSDGTVRITYDHSLNLLKVEGERQLHGVTVYDMQGRPVAADHRKRDAYEVSLQGVSKGVYVIKVNEKGHFTARKIVK